MIYREPATTTREAEGVVPSSADPVFGVPIATAFDAKARPQGVVHCVAKEFLCWRWLGVRAFHGTAEEQFKLRTSGTKFGRWCEGKGERTNDSTSDDSRVGY